MKRKLLFAALCVVSALGLRAQTDVTSTHLDNPSFELSAANTELTDNVKASNSGALSIYGWTETLGNTDYNNREIVDNDTKGSNSNHSSSISAAAGSYHFFMRRSWNNSDAKDFTYKSNTATYEAGFYTITYSYILEEGTSSGNTTTGSYMTLQALNESDVIASERVNAKNWGTTTPYTNTWATSTMTFSLTEEKELALAVVITPRGGNKTEVHLDNFVITCTPFATTGDYTNLNSAISAVESKALGFDTGEYAPYEHAAVLQALAEAKAIDQNANNSQVTVQNLTTTLNNATWTANTEEVNAFYDGTFSDAASVTGNTCPTGWHGSDDHYTDGYWVRLMYSNGSSNTGLQHFANSCAMMAKSTPRYGLEPGYTMPLNADTYYKLSFDFAGWGGGNSGLKTTIVVTDGSDGAITVNPAQTEGQNQNGQSDQNAWKTYTGYFKTGDAGNYKLLLSKTEGDGSGYQITYGDMVLKTLTVADATAYYNTVLDEVDDSYDAVANGGSEKTAFKDALDATVPSTVAEIMAAAANLYSLRDAFVAATPKYNDLETERTSAIALGVTSEAANAVTMTSADQLQEKLQALYVLEDAAVTAGYAVDATTMFGSWTSQNLTTKNDEHWSGTTVTYFDKWQDSGFTGSITSTVTLPAGKYVFKLAARAQTGGVNGAFNMSVKVGDNVAVYKNFVAKDNTGKGITTSGAVSYSDGEFCNNGNGRGWEWRFIGFELDTEATVTLKGYAQIYANNWVGFSDATLLTTSDNVAVLKELLNTEIDTATAIDKTTNVGEGVFQTPPSAVSALNAAIATAQGVYDNSSATSSEVSTATSDLQTAEATYKATVNAPADGKKYYIKVATTGHAKADKAWLLAAGETSVNNKTGYTIAANEDPADYLAQAFTFTQVSGNTYNISMTLPEGETYLTYGSLNESEAGWNKMQIQATTNAANKGEFKIYAGNAANTFKIFNTEQNDYIDCQDGGNIYTDTGITKELFAVAEATQVSVPVTVAADKYATRIFPFTPSVIDGITYYSCAAVDGSTLTLAGVDNPEANKPYILLASKDVNETLTGWGTATADKYTEGLLTGVYAETEVPNENYVLQTLNEKQAFYQVDSSDPVSAPAYRAYLTVGGGDVKAFFFNNDDTDAINSIENAALTIENATIYNLAGQRINKVQKGVNIINGKKYLVK